MVFYNYDIIEEVKNMVKIICGSIVDDELLKKVGILVCPIHHCFDFEYGKRYGMCGEIFKKGGREQLEEYCKNNFSSELQMGEVRLIQGFNLPCKILLTKAPDSYKYLSWEKAEEDLLQTYRNILDYALNHNETILLPSLGTGLYGFEYERIAYSVMYVLTNSRYKRLNITFVHKDKRICDIFSKALRESIENHKFEYFRMSNNRTVCRSKFCEYRYYSDAGWIFTDKGYIDYFLWKATSPYEVCKITKEEAEKRIQNRIDENSLEKIYEKIKDIRRIDRFKGCMIGGAIGDAMGYPVEFHKDYEIKELYNGFVDKYELRNGVAQISDDTQMSLFTAVGLLVGTTRADLRGISAPYTSYIWNEYKDWYKMQTSQPIEYTHSWLVNVKELGENRAPGTTCMQVLSQEKIGTITKPINNSKGCGGIMRVAPIALYLTQRNYKMEHICIIAAQSAALTHGHELGYIPAAMLTYILSRLLDKVELVTATIESISFIEELFPNAEHIKELTDIIRKAIRLAFNKESDIDNIKILGEGWVAEETLAIAIYCSLRYKYDFKKAICVSVSHGGDSDSTGAITGNILGAFLGIRNIPDELIKPLELKEVIESIAVDLSIDESGLTEDFGAYESDEWIAKYVNMDYKG